MYPDLFKAGDFTVGSFGVLVALAFLVAYIVAAGELKRKGAPPSAAQDMFVWISLCSIVGAKLFFVTENFTFAEIISDPVPVLFSRNGLTFYGGLLGGIAGGIYAARKNGVQVRKALDAVAPALAIGYAIGRIGCLLVGDDYGTASDLPWAMAFPNGYPPVDFTVHPTQIYESVLMFAVFALLWRIRKTAMPDGRLFALYLALAGTERFLVEFIRTTTQSGFAGLSVAQVIALASVTIGCVWLVVSRPSGSRHEL